MKDVPLLAAGCVRKERPLRCRSGVAGNPPPTVATCCMLEPVHGTTARLPPPKKRKKKKKDERRRCGVRVKYRDEMDDDTSSLPSTLYREANR